MKMASLQALVVALWLISSVAFCSSRTPKRGSAPTFTCSLAITGFGSSKHGIQDMHLHCNGGDGTLQVGVNDTHVGKFVDQFSGVEVTDAKACTETAPMAYNFMETDDDTSDASDVVVHPLLCFAGSYKITFDSLSVEDVWLDYDSVTKGYTTAILVRNDSTSAQIVHSIFMCQHC